MEGFLLFLAFLVVVGFPSANLQVFDGLPFSRLFEFGALILTVPFLIFPDLRNRQMIFWKGLKIRPVFLWTSLAVLLLLKGTLLASGAHTGFSACYRSPAEPTTITHEDLPPRECERSYENLFDRFSATRTDSAVWFAPDTWNLVFLNTNRYNYYDWEAGNILRDRIPLQARWSGVPEFKPGDTIRIEYVGQGTVAWGGTQIPLPPSYAAPNVVEFTAAPTAAALQIDYAFDDGSRSGQDPQSWGPRATIKVSAGKPGSMVPLVSQSAAPGWKAAALLADALILLWLCSFLPGLWTSVGSDLLALIVFAMGAGVISLIPVPSLIREIGITAALAVFLTVHLAVRPFRPATVYFSAIVAAFLILRVWSSGGPGQVLLRSAGNDPLSYESQAYSILYKGSLQGGESVFEYIPMYRYIKFLEHAIFGDGNMLSAAAQLAAFFGGVFWLFRMPGTRRIAVLPRVFMIFLGCSLIFLGGYYVSGIIRDGLSEYDTWILLLWALPALYWQASSAAILSGALALAVSYTIRPNQILGILWILFLAAIGSWKKYARTVLLVGVLALGIALLPLVHNLYFGHQWVLSATSGNLPVNLLLLPSTWLAFLHGDPAAVETVHQQIGMVFLIADVPRSVWPTLAAMALCFACWLGVTGYSVARRWWPELAILVVPVFFLAIHFIYGVSTYYPRHIVIAYLSMAIVTVLVLIRHLPDLPAPCDPAVELPQK
jgi:hypothetical protein